MKQFKKIFRFEFKNYASNKTFIGITAFLVALITIVMFFPRIKGLFDGTDKRDEAVDPSEREIMLVCAQDEALETTVVATFAVVFPNYDVRSAEGDASSVKTQIEEGDAECAFVFDSATEYTYYVVNLSMYDTNTSVADAALVELYRVNAMVEAGVPVEEAGAIMSATVTHTTENLGKDQMKNFFYTYIMIFALYMVILLYGQMVATGVATEKSSRAMELLITSAKPVSMMFGKVMAACAAGFTQLFCVFGTAVLCFNLNREYWDEGGIISSIFDMPIELFVYMLIFFVLGFFIYAFLYGAIGSTASKLEDINTSVMPITFLFVVGFVIVMIALSSGDVDTPLMIACSYIPFTSPMAMFTRIAMSTVALWEIILSISILIVSAMGVGVLAAKIYRIGVLLYGTPPRLSAIIKAIRNA